MIYLLHGEETILSREKLRGIIKTYVDKYQYLNFFDFDFSKTGGGKKNSFDDLRNDLFNTSLFVTKKLVVARNLFDQPVILEKFFKLVELNNLVDDQDFIVFLFEDKKINQTDLVEIKKIAKIQEFKKISTQEIRLFIQKEVASLGATISQEVVEKLLGANENMYWIKNELKKLATFDKNINLKNLEFLITLETNPGIFELTDSLAIGNKKQAFRVFEELLKRGESEMGIFAMIIFLVRSLLIVKDSRDSDSSYGGLNPHVFNKLKRGVEKFSLISLKEMYRELFEMELAFKSGRGQIRPLLTSFFFRF
ncbi:hypothetical protein HY061_03255 [Candidatus Azambacteria bacterium]|nr:hypothetical protein [Candidatus Azambacteria bacterium]